MFSQGRSLAADSESTGQQTTKQPPGPPLQAQLEKVASTSFTTIGHDQSAVMHSAVRGSPMNLRDPSWWPPLFFPTQNG